ncbi:TonB-dependent receptor [Luteimonas sp. YGD11-2]|uniref:TonB-dependent receptor n=1 Tax=Luteimonas sp. YGD11-2 TaxID=2508168 RepID=UPI00100B9DF9|nr:TonB-dependent receptor [Luteimonas sp. YGD11-2]
MNASRVLRRTLLSCALGSALALSAPVALAQSTAATLRGQVSVDSAPAADARVTATNTGTGLTRSAQVGANGSYNLAGLPPGTYRIDVTANGQTTSETVTLRVGQTATLDLGVGGVAETGPQQATDMDTVVVTGTRMAETRTSEVATYVSPRQIEMLPQGSRNFLAFADTVPGMTFVERADGSTQLRSGAQSANGVNVYIDGVGQKNYVTKGGVSSQDSTRGNPFPQLAIGEYKVITSNYKAEYDQISSAAVTAVTRSGTNEFEGSFFWDRTGDDWRASTPSELERGEKIPSRSEQYGVALGGPILRDRLHFFVTYEAKEIVDPREVRLGTTTNFPVPLIPEVEGLLGTANRPFDSDLYFGKLSWQINDEQLLELTAKRRDETEITGIGDGPNTPSFGSAKNNEETRLDLRHQFSAENWLNDAHVTYEDAYWNPRAITLGPGYRLHLPEAIGRGTLVNYGGGEDFQNKGQKGWSFQNDLTFFGWEGHAVKMGIKYKDVELDSLEQQPYNQQLEIDYLANLAAGNTTLASFVPNRVRFGAPLPGFEDRTVNSPNRQFGIYIQDDWEVNEHLTLNLGVRWDYEKTEGYENYVTPAGLANALRTWSNLDNADYDIEDYISSGNNRSAFKGAWQPRLGFSYDINADQRHVIFGGAGRAYDRNLFDYIALEQSKSTFPTYTFDFTGVPGAACTPGPTCIPWDPAYLDINNLYALVAANPNLGAEVNLMNNDLDVPYSDQFSLGMRNALTLGGHEWMTSVTLSHVRSYDGILFTLGNRRPDGSFFPPGADFGNSPWDFRIPGYGTLIIADNGVETRLNSILLSVDKAYTPDSGWGMTFAYTYSDAEENRGNAAQNDEHYLFDLPNLNGAPFIDSVGIPRHRVVATGIADVWGGLTLSGKLTLESPVARDVTVFTSPLSGYFDSYYGDRTIEYKQLDLALQKVWNTGTDLSFRIRGDVFNVFNWDNWNDYDPMGAQRGLSIRGPTRYFKLSFSVDW